MAIKLEMLRTFRAVADHGTLLGAAEALGRTPSAISMTLAQLEDELGGPLFETERKNQLSQIGQLVLEECIRATETFSHSVEAIRRHVTSVAGTVRIAAVPSATVTLLPRAVVTFQKIRPEVRLEISDVDTIAVQRRIRNHEADIGIVTGQGPLRDNEETVLNDRLCIVHREDGPLAQTLSAEASAPTWDMIDFEPLIANPLCELVDHKTVSARLTTCTLQARNTTALLSFVREGLGVTILPESASTIAPSGVLFSAPADGTFLRELRLIRNPDRRPSPVAKMFWDVLLSSAQRNGST